MKGIRGTIEGSGKSVSHIMRRVGGELTHSADGFRREKG